MLIAGPCVIESEAHATELAGAPRRASPGAPACRSSSRRRTTRRTARRAARFAGPGLDEGLRVLGGDQGAPRRADPDRHPRAGAGARRRPTSPTSCRFRRSSRRQTDLLVAAARTGRVVNIKKGQFLAPDDVQHAVAKVVDAGNPRVIVTERGTSFGYHNLVVDMRAFPMMRALGVPVVFDVTHSLQLPGGGDGVTAGPGRVHRAAGVGRRRRGRRRRVPRSARGPGAREERRAERAAPRSARAAAPPPDAPSTRSPSSAEAPRVRWLIARSRARCSKPKPPRSSRSSTALDERFDRAVAAAPPVPRPRHPDRHGQVGHHLPARSRRRSTSTGTPAFFLHPAEAIHGDLGVIQSDDVVVALSYSGETDETAAAARDDPPARREADRDHRQPGVDARRRPPTSRSTAASPRKRAR